MYVTRFLEKELREYMEKPEILAILGPRQAGKTTLMEHLFSSLQNAQFISFEDRQTLELFSEDVKSFAELYVKPYQYLFIDEFQYASEGGKNLKYIYDHHKTKLIISGSSATGLSIHGIRYLTGRILAFQLDPFSFEEYLAFKEPAIYPGIYAQSALSPPIIDRIMPHFNEFCVFGGYPRVVLAKTPEEKQTVLKNIYNTYFLKEVREILNLPKDHQLSKLISALALQIGNIVNYNELCSISGFGYKELLNYLNILEKTFIIAKSTPFHTNKRTELVKTPKMFFYDSGLRNTVIRDFQPIERRTDKGMLYENFVASELIKKQYPLKYWRTKAKAEVDFIVENNGKTIPVEVKSHLAEPKTGKSMASFNEKYSSEKAIILSEKLSVQKDHIKFCPIFRIGKEI
ncbi:MAG: ATP-binding protein [Candidatus Diapherotrites archaeon]|nr:ATP-binding protein [Candidatus Diapherotrites archaeon]